MLPISFLTTLCLVCMVNGYTLENVERLKQHLFANYSKDIRPIKNQSEPIEIAISFKLRSILHLDMGNGQLDTMGYMVTNWIDARLSWEGTEFNDIPGIALNGEDLWDPFVGQMDAMEEQNKVETIYLQRNGVVIRGEIRKFYTFCELNMRYYPMDKHDCIFEFVSLKYAAHYVKLVPHMNGIDTSLLKKHGEWMVAEISMKYYAIDHPFGGLSSQPIEFTLVLERQPSFNIIHKVIPLFILAVSALFIHIVPLNSGERISYAVTVLLAFVFWKAIVSEDLPKNSSKISICSMYITVALCASGIFTITSVVLCRMSSIESDRQIPGYLQRLAFKFRKKKKQTQVYKIKISHSNDSYEENTSVQQNGEPMKRFDRSTSSNSRDLVENPNDVSWLEAAYAIDVVLFYIHLALCSSCAVSFVLVFALQI